MACGAMGGRGVDEKTVRLGGTGNRRKPSVENREFLNQLGVNRYGLRSEPFHHRLRQVARHGQSLFHETHHRRDSTRPEYLLLHCLERVARIRIHELCVVGEAYGSGVIRVFCRNRVAFSTRDSVDRWVYRFLHPTQHVIEGSILHHQNDDGFDRRLPLMGSLSYVGRYQEARECEKERESEGKC